MDPITVGVIGIVALLVLIVIGMPVGFVMCLVGFGEYAYLTSFKAAIGLLKIVPYETCANYGLSVIPLFILMGYFALYSGLSRELFTFFYRWIGFVPGGLAIATVGGCAGFASICGASPATAATMGTVAISIPEYPFMYGASIGVLFLTLVLVVDFFVVVLNAKPIES